VEKTPDERRRQIAKTVLVDHCEIRYEPVGSPLNLMWFRGTLLPSQLSLRRWIVVVVASPPIAGSLPSLQVAANNKLIMRFNTQSTLLMSASMVGSGKGKKGKEEGWK
jgi:hypothetical protein